LIVNGCTNLVKLNKLKSGINPLHLLSRPNSSVKENFNSLQMAQLRELQKRFQK